MHFSDCQDAKLELLPLVIRQDQAKQPSCAVSHGHTQACALVSVQQMILNTVSDGNRDWRNQKDLEAGERKRESLLTSFRNY